jgi:hypothetical protein
MTRGDFRFQLSADGGIADCDENVAVLRRLWTDRTLIKGDDLGPGDTGDFDHGAWHVSCHLTAGGGVKRSADGGILWLEISHDPSRDAYYASVTAETGGQIRTFALDSPEGRALLHGSTLLGFVEGNSTGRTSARGVVDAVGRFNGWMRQNFDQQVGSRADGGKVWEHWCTLRDLRETDAVSASVLRAYVSLTAALGDAFVSTVARGRRDYGHPKQLCAMVKAGLVSESSAVLDLKPDAIPKTVQRLFLEAAPGSSLEGARQLQWEAPPRYYMFKRRISRWSPAASVKKDLEEGRL